MLTLAIAGGVFLGELGIYVVRQVVAYIALRRFYRKQDELYAKIPQARTHSGYGFEDVPDTVN